MAHPKTLLGARVEFTDGERLPSSDLDRMGDVALLSLWHLVARLCESEVDGNPIQGFPGTDCLVTHSSGITVSVAAGFGVYYDAAATAQDYELSAYRPIVVPAAFTATMAAHDATNPRIDIVCLAPAVDTDAAESRNIKSPTTLDTSTQTVDKREVLSYAVQVVTGTPAATPAAPATPAGYLKIAEVRVPAVSGNATVTDVRQLLQLGHAWRTHPKDVTDDYVPGSGGELDCSAVGTFVVTIAAGEAVISGFRYRYRASTVTISGNSSGNDRIDVVVADRDGTIKVVVGTPSATPVAPAVGAYQLSLCTVSVLNGTAGILDMDLTDTRVREPISTAQIQDANVTTAKIAGSAVTTAKIANGNVTGAKLSVVPVIPQLTVGAEAANAIAVSIQMRDLDGNNVARVVRFVAEVYLDSLGVDNSGDYRLSETGAGTMVRPTNHPAPIYVSTIVVDTDANGAAQVTCTDNVTGANRGVFLLVTPVGTAGYPALADLPFN